MKGHSQFNFIRPFRNAPAVDITLGGSDLPGPASQEGRSKGLDPRTNNVKERKTKPVSQVELGDHVVDTIEVRRAIPEKSSPIVNFYTFGTVLNTGDGNMTHPLGKTLIDGGSVMNIIPLYLARRLEPRLAHLGFRNSHSHRTNHQDRMAASARYLHRCRHDYCNGELHS